MKKIVMAGATLVLALTAGSAFAVNSLNAGTIGFNVGAAVDSQATFKEDLMINARYFITKDMAVLAGLGIAIAGGDAKGTDIAFMGGFRKYLKTDDLAPFVGGRVQYQSTQDSTQTAMAVMAEAGAEYFLAKQFSVEGRFGFGYASIEQKAPTFTPNKRTSIGTAAFGLGANFYF